MMDRARQGSTIERMPESTSPLATIAITTHDRPDLLRRAVDSALAQSVRDLEVIVVDDGSAEPVIMDRSDSRLRVLRNDRPLGVSAARNRGLWAARGHWITFTDDDDELLPEMVQASLEAVQRSTLPPPVAVLSGLEVLDHGGRLIEVRQPTRIPRGTPPFRGAPDDGFSQDLNTLFAPVEILRSMGGWDDHIKGWEMDDLLIRLTEVMSLEGTPQVTYRRFRHQGPRKSNNADIALAGGELVLSKHLVLPGPPAAPRPPSGHPEWHLPAGGPLVAGRPDDVVLGAGRPQAPEGGPAVDRHPDRTARVRLLPARPPAPERAPGP